MMMMHDDDDDDDDDDDAFDDARCRGWRVIPLSI
jgi:hypothetical protein